jgi:ribosomal protein L40E
MDEGVKKVVLICVIVGCFGLAGVITFRSCRPSGGGGLEDIPAGETVWVKCANKDCAAAYEMDKREYYRYIQENAPAMAMSVAPLVCEKCGKPSVYRAEKCEKCETIFFRGSSAPGDFADRCPNCGYSKSEEERKPQ